VIEGEVRCGGGSVWLLIELRARLLILVGRPGVGSAAGYRGFYCGMESMPARSMGREAVRRTPGRRD